MQIEIMSNDQSNNIFIICNTITGKATVSAPTPALIEKAYHYVDRHMPKRGPEQVICMFSRAIGITLSNFHMYPKSMIWDGVSSYAKQKVSQ